jgi:hypothetical protein
MKRTLASLAALALAAATGPAAAQAPAPAPEPKTAQQPLEQPRPKLNLKLDDPAAAARESARFGPAEKQDAPGLPSLGGEARPMEPVVTRPGTRNSPYPSEPNAFR